MSPWRSAFRRTLIYVIFGILWILYSDQLLATMVDDAAALTRLQTYKGWGFIIITGGLFMLLTAGAIRREHTLIERDKLTQLLNRFMFEQELEAELALAAQGGKQIALIVLNIDNFRSINHAAGQSSGDWVLVQIADIIRQQCSNTRAVYARIAGDEFAIAIIDSEHYESVIERVRLIQRHIQELKIPSHPTINISGGIGLACFPNDADNYRDLLTAANLALEEAFSAL